LLREPAGTGIEENPAWTTLGSKPWPNASSKPRQNARWQLITSA
jgi:hypothetical protein